MTEPPVEVSSMKHNHFGRQSSALSLLGLLAACAISAASGGCRLELSDGKADNGGDGPAGVTKAGDGGAPTASGGAPPANGGAPSGGRSGVASGGTQAGSAHAGAGPSGGARSTAVHMEDCENRDAIPNDDREHAVDFGAGAILCLAESESDWFYVDMPSDGRAHVIEFDIKEQDDSLIYIAATAEKDGSDLGTIRPSQRGLKLSAFVTVGPGTRTFFEVKGAGSSNDNITTIDLLVSAEMDDHEPNNDRASATSIQPASEISAQLILPYVSATDQQIEDWYKIELSA